tara:strand:- start:4707 stop:5849 length:1143 start_codon:yes stop_codon:yes gene_type:complete
MPFFSFSINEIKPSLKTFNITVNNVYFSKNTELWKILNKKSNSNIIFLKYEKRLPVKNIGKKILLFLPPSIGLGDAIEYASAINKLIESTIFDKVAVAFTGDYTFLFRDYFKINNCYKYTISQKDISTFDTIFHLTLEIKSLGNQKYFRSNIFYEIVNFFNIKININNKIKLRKKNKVSKISIFPLSSSPIRTMPINILSELIKILKRDYIIEIFLDNNSEISNHIYKKLNLENIFIVDPEKKSDLIYLIKNIQYGLFMDSGPLHVAKMFNKRGILLETSVSSKILLKNCNSIMGLENTFSSAFCKAPCGLTDIFNYSNKFGCYDSLKIKSKNLKKNNFQNIINRGVKNYYLENFKKPVGCLSSLNVQNIYNAIKKDLSL